MSSDKETTTAASDQDKEEKDLQVEQAEVEPPTDRASSKLAESKSTCGGSRGGLAIVATLGAGALAVGLILKLLGRKKGKKGSQSGASAPAPTATSAVASTPAATPATAVAAETTIAGASTTAASTATTSTAASASRPQGAGVAGGPAKGTAKKPSEAKTCLHCSSTPASKRCSRCKQAWFCSVDCQKAAWPQHKLVCKPATASGSSASASASNGSTTTNSPSTSSSSSDQTAAAASAAAKKAAMDDNLNKEMARTMELFGRGAFREAITALDELAAKAKDAGRAAVECEALRLAGHAWIKLDNLAHASRSLNKALELAYNIGDKALEGGVHIAFGQLHTAKGDTQAAIQHHTEAKRLAIKSGDMSGEAVACVNIANSHARAGDFDKFSEVMLRALELRRKGVEEAEASGRPSMVVEARRAEAAAVANYGTSLNALGDEKGAIEKLEEALGIVEELGGGGTKVIDSELERTLLVNLSNTYDNDMEGSGCVLVPPPPFTEGGHGKAVEYRRRLADLMRRQGLGRLVPDKCAICLEALHALEADDDGGEKVTSLECMHFYHTKCWSGWIERDNSCPECKRTVQLVD